MLEEKDSSGDTRYTDFNDWMSQLYPSSTEGRLAELAMNLKDLYKRCCAALGVGESVLDTTYPASTTTGIGSMKLHLWQLGFTEASFIRGATSAYNVFKCMEKDCLDGGATQKYPIEICPFLGGGLPGEGVEAFSIMTSIGGSVVTSAYLICLHAIRAGYFAAAG